MTIWRSSQTEGKACIFKNNFAEITFFFKLSFPAQRAQKLTIGPGMNLFLHDVHSIGPLITFFSLAAIMMRLFK